MLTVFARKEIIRTIGLRTTTIAWLKCCCPPSTSPSPSRRKSRKPGAAQQWASTPGHLFNFQLKRANTLNEVEMHLHLRPRTAGQIAGHYLSIDIATREWLDNCFRLSRNKTKMKTNKKTTRKKDRPTLCWPVGLRAMSSQPSTPVEMLSSGRSIAWGFPRFPENATCQ